MAQGRVPSGLPGHPAPQNWTPDGRVTAAGYQPRAPSTAGSAPSPAAPPVAPPGRPRGDADLGGAARFRASPRCRLVDTGSLSCNPELLERVEAVFNPL